MGKEPPPAEEEVVVKEGVDEVIEKPLVRGGQKLFQIH